VTNEELHGSLARLYWLMGLFGITGFVSYFWMQGVQSALSFALGAAASFGNLWLFSWLSASISPGDHARKPWKATLYVLRYGTLVMLGYGIVKSLKINGLALILGLFLSTAAVLVSLIFEIVQGLVRSTSR
jgi:uncharacterized membrane protein